MRSSSTRSTSRRTPRAPGPTTRSAAAASCSSTAHEIDKIDAKIREKGFTLIPLALYFKDGRAKVELALARGKKQYDKRHSIAERTAKREAEIALGRKVKGMG